MLYFFSKDELKDAMTQYGYFTDDEIDDMMMQADTDSDGKISYKGESSIIVHYNVTQRE